MRTEKLRGGLVLGAAILLLSGTGLAQQQQQPMQEGQQQVQEGMAGQEAAAGLSETEIAELQRMLNEAGYDVGPVDGIWGPQTAGAVESFQRDQGLDPTGRLDVETLYALGMDDAAARAGMPQATGATGMPGEQQPGVTEQQQPGATEQQPTQPQQ